MQITKIHKILISIIILAVLLFIYIIFGRTSKENLIQPDNNDTETTQSTTTTVGTGLQIKTQGTGDYKIEQVPVTEGREALKPIPVLTRKVVFGSDLSLTPEVKIMIEKKVSEFQSELSKNPTDFSAWINLGVYQKMAGDYSATIESWKYASLLSPTDYISLSNLGNLYAYNLKDNAKAESYYKKAITNGPTQVYLYIQLAEFYRDFFGDKTKALAIVNQGLLKIPNDPNLLQLKTSLNK